MNTINSKAFLSLFFLLVTFSSLSQWGIAYGSGWGNQGLKYYPNFFKSVDYVGDGINGHRMDIYFPSTMKVNLNNIFIDALNKKYDKIDKAILDLKKEKKKYPCVIIIYGSA